LCEGCKKIIHNRPVNKSHVPTLIAYRDIPAAGAPDEYYVQKLQISPTHPVAAPVFADSPAAHHKSASEGVAAATADLVVSRCETIVHLLPILLKF
jgi:hypothetical protein